jgi:4-azaleucine resistance transporter AzlC
MRLYNIGLLSQRVKARRFVMNRRAFSAAVPATLPVMTGYLSIGIAFGLLLQRAGYHFLWALFMSVTVYAGSAQFLEVELLSKAAGLGTVAIMSALINVRLLVYGLSMIEKFRGMGWRKGYMIFSLTDETYALLAGTQVPAGIDPGEFYFAVSLLNHSYWVLGSVLGGIAGGLLTLDIRGIDFAMTALFVVIAVDQWRSVRQHLPALLGLGATALSLLLLGRDQMLVPALPVIILALLLLRPILDKEEACGQ